LTQVFRALSDPTRRAVLKRLSRGPVPTLELGRPFGMALPSFTQHLRMLEKFGLVKSRKTGRVRTYVLERVVDVSPELVFKAWTTPMS
jgi:DNA-binding transcriptional ArsR family regulator